MEISKSQKNLVISHEIIGQDEGEEIIRLVTKNPLGLRDALESQPFTQGGDVLVVINGVDEPGTLVGQTTKGEPLFWHSSAVMPLQDFAQLRPMPEGIELPAYGEALLFVPPKCKEQVETWLSVEVARSSMNKKEAVYE